jgi:hypothetical protein
MGNKQNIPKNKQNILENKDKDKDNQDTGTSPSFISKDKQDNKKYKQTDIFELIKDDEFWLDG